MKKEIAAIIKEWKEEAHVSGIITVSKDSGTRKTIIICTNAPEFMIGYNEGLLNKYKEKLKVINPKLQNIEFVDTDTWYIK